MLTNTTSKIGRVTEKYVADYLFEKGWGVILIPKRLGGQPFDLIALKNNEFLAGDVKHILYGNTFPLLRIEPNQISALNLMKARGNTRIGLFLKFADSENIYFKKWSEIDFTKKSIHREECTIL